MYIPLYLTELTEHISAHMPAQKSTQTDLLKLSLFSFGYVFWIINMTGL